MTHSIIKIKNLSKEFEYFPKEAGLRSALKNLFKRKKVIKKAVKGITFSVSEGEIVGFLGPNGAGKTTTLKMLSGILTPTSGEAQVLGYVPWQRRRDFQRQIALVMGQKNQLWWDLPPLESFLLYKEIYEIPSPVFEKNLEELVTSLKIKEIIKKPVRKLSLGERMKSELAAALLPNPRVLFLDEPTIGLDVVAQKNLRDFLKKYNQKTKTTILLTSHYMEDIVALCRRIVVINEGKIIFDGQLEDLIKKYAPNKMITIYFKDKPPRRDLEKIGQIYEEDEYKVVFKIPRQKIKEKAALIFSLDLPIEDIDISEVDAESVVRNIFNTRL